jgi:hypothetical protein
MGARNRVEIELKYRPAARLHVHRLAESIPGLLKSLKIPSLAGRYDNSVPIRFLVPIDSSKIPAQDSNKKFYKGSVFHVRITDLNLHDAPLNNLPRYCNKLSFSIFALLLIKAKEDTIVGERGNGT